MARRTDPISETRRQVAGLFGPGVPAGRPPRIGVEAEFLLFRAGNRNEPVAIDDVQGALASAPSIARAGHPSFEPGGQLELSPSPAPSPRLAIDRIEELSRRTASALRRSGIAMVAAGVDAWRPPEIVRLQTLRDRYLVMERHFDAIGPSGRRMMRQTASLQVCIDRTAGAAGARQWLAANLIGPALAAAFRTSGADDNRTAIWLGVDPSRTGFDGHQVDSRHPADAYLPFALAAEVMALPRAGDDAGLPPRRTTLAAWIARGEARPGAEDIAHHLSTLFPPVRPRGRYLEVRYLDAQPSARRSTAITLLAILLADPVAREAAIEIGGGETSDLGSAWRRSAHVGLTDPCLHRTALESISAAVRRVEPIERTWPGWLPSDARSSLERLAADLEARRPAALAS